MEPSSSGRNEKPFSSLLLDYMSNKGYPFPTLLCSEMFPTVSSIAILSQSVTLSASGGRITLAVNFSSLKGLMPAVLCVVTECATNFTKFTEVALALNNAVLCIRQALEVTAFSTGYIPGEEFVT